MVGISTKECSKEAGCAKEGTSCGSISTEHQAGPYVVDCGGKHGKYVWIELPGKDRSINVATVEVEKSALCEQVVLRRKGADIACLHYTEYSGERAEPDEGFSYTSAVCHPAGKVGPTGMTGPKGDKGKQGDQGPKGKTGEKGDEGEEGAVGEQGDVGAEGPEGLEADVTGLATMGQLNGAGVLCVSVTIAVLVILQQKVAAKKGGGATDAGEGKAGEGEEGEEVFEEGVEEGYEEGPEKVQEPSLGILGELGAEALPEEAEEG
eukprot:Skav230103  [mRNA]  locus=scaffold283:129489:136273:- [translate_table: standard]